MTLVSCILTDHVLYDNLYIRVAIKKFVHLYAIALTTIEWILVFLIIGYNFNIRTWKVVLSYVCVAQIYGLFATWASSDHSRKRLYLSDT